MNVSAQGPQEPKFGRSSDVQGPARVRPRDAGAASPAPVASDGIELSPQAQAFLEFRPRLDGDGDVAAPRHERIARLRDAIANGRYAVEGERIAGAMLRDEGVVRMLGLRLR
jgi:flagellar biosynthesis anti-sigma factor FlgM